MKCCYKYTAYSEFIGFASSFLVIPPCRSMGGILSLLCLFIHSLCTVTDFSARALPIGVKFGTAVRPHLGQVFAYFGG